MLIARDGLVKEAPVLLFPLIQSKEIAILISSLNDSTQFLAFNNQKSNSRAIITSIHLQI
jgi:hypothetical protein